MKVTNIRKKLAAALASAGMLTPGAAAAADLNTNLVINGGFEDVNLLSVAPLYSSPQILHWMGTSAFAYSHEPDITGVPDFAEPADNSINPPSAGNWYFTSNNAGATDLHAPGLFYQDIDVSGGASGNAISSGIASFAVSAWMTSYGTNSDIGQVHLNFLNGIGTSLGTALMSDSDAGPNNVWSLESATGGIPVGTSTVRLSLYGTPLQGAADGYIDNVEFSVTDILPTLSISVDRETGGIVLSNKTGSSVNLSSYVITSAFGSLAPANWRSIADHYDAGSPGPGQVDAIHNWSELTNPSAHGDLSEADLESGTGAMLAAGQTINLSSADAWLKSPTEDLVFQYISNGAIVDGFVSFTENNDQRYVVGDLNTDGFINATDWGILRSNQHKALSSDSLAEAYRMGDLTGDGLNNHADFVAFKNLYDAANGAGSFAAMVSATVPEPSTIVLLMSAGLFALPLVRHRSNEG